MEKTPMRDTEIVLNSPETDARETPTQGLNEHHDTKQRPRARALTGRVTRPADVPARGSSARRPQRGCRRPAQSGRWSARGSTTGSTDRACAGRNVSERRASLETTNVQADPPGVAGKADTDGCKSDE